MTLFNGKIYCNICGKKHKYKKRAKKPVYVCSKYDNYGSKACIRNQIDEEDILWFVYGHFSIDKEEVTRCFVDDNIDRIIVDNYKTEIFYKNGEVSFINPQKLVR